MSDAISKVFDQNSGNREDAKRAAAVAAALELIKVYASSAHPKFSMSDQMNLLSSYADQIQRALEGK